MADEADKLMTSLEAIGLFIDDVIVKTEQGHIMDVSRLDTEVPALCDRLERLPPEEARRVEPAMAAVIAKLESLAVALQIFQDTPHP